MTLTSKYDIGDKVWAFESGIGKYYKGTVTNITSWDTWGGFHYEIQHNGEEQRTINAEEKFIYANKTEIDSNCFVDEIAPAA